MLFKDLDLQIKGLKTSLTINETTFEVKNYLPIQDKIDMITFIISNALDENTGCFSPVRVEVFFSLAICKWYADMDFEDRDPIEVYDLLEENEVFSKIMGAIPEYEFISDLVLNTISDIERYNSSAAGILHNMNINSEDLTGTAVEFLDKVKNAEGLELLEEIKNITGTDKKETEISEEVSEKEG